MIATRTFQHLVGGLLTLASLTLIPQVASAQILGAIDSPQPNATVGQPFTINGWAVMTGEATGIDVVWVWGCPVLDCTAPTFWGQATYGIARPDVAAAYNNQNYLNSGYSLLMSGLTPNASYYAKVQAHAWQTNVWYEFVVQFTATSTPIHTLESPAQNGQVPASFAVSGWAIDGAAATGTGVDTIDIWQYANVGSGAAPTQLTGVTTGVSRPDVAAVYGSRFQPSGYSKSLSSVPAGIYWYEVLAHSTATGAWTVRTALAYVNLPMADLTITRGGTGTGGITASVGGLSCPGGPTTQAVPCSAPFNFGTQVTLTAVPDAGMAFGGWIGVCSGVGTCTVTIDAAKFVSALFLKPLSTFTVSYYHTDAIGSVRAVTDSTGTPLARHDYAPFGEDPVPLNNDPQPLRFAGKEVDLETALHYFEARYYRQTWGRFSQVDPVHVGAAMVDPQQWNRYAYARNNPLSYGDPSGLYTTCATFNGSSTCRSTEGTPPDSSWQYYEGAGMLGARGMTSGGQGGAGQCEGIDSNGNFYMWQWCDGSPEESTQASSSSSVIDTVQEVLNTVSIGVTATGVGEPAAVVIDVANAVISAVRGNWWDAVTSAWAAIPYVGISGNLARATKSALDTPRVASGKLQNIISDLYRGTTNPNRVGNGTTMDAIRHELSTGEKVGGVFHSQKGTDYARSLENWLRANPDAPYRDRVVAQSILDDLRSAMRGGR